MRALTIPLLLCSCSAAQNAPSAPAVKPACASTEHRQLDFWIGTWDVVIRARASPESTEWAQGTGRQHVEAILGGCAIAESFAADGPQAPWAGRSYSTWQATLGTWRQTWVDDAGNYLAFTGGVEDGRMTLYGEPRTAEDVSFQMRMVFKNVMADALLWEWQRSTDGWKTSTLMMAIDYERRH